MTRRWIVRLFVLASALCACLVSGSPGLRAEPERCPRLVSDLGPRIVPAAYTPSAPAGGERTVSLTFLGHASFLIESPKGVTIVTDYSDATKPAAAPTIATMNIAHITHYTMNPDPGIAHLLRGWSTTDTPANYDLTVNDVWVRNVTTDLRGWGDELSPGRTNMNSMFVFEVAGLCIAHLGHLHHKLSREHLNALGRIDVVLAPVDGSYTLGVEAMVEVLRDIGAPLVIPMHYFGPTTLARLVSRLDQDYEVSWSERPDVLLSRETLPSQPTVLVLPGF
jgi:L-ascorbate metabolism protein UlaG (beta-lactamase superfamily)